jgi:hypothetical protein
MLDPERVDAIMHLVSEIVSHDCENFVLILVSGDQLHVAADFGEDRQEEVLDILAAAHNSLRS